MVGGAVPAVLSCAQLRPRGTRGGKGVELAFLHLSNCRQKVRVRAAASWVKYLTGTELHLCQYNPLRHLNHRHPPPGAFVLLFFLGGGKALLGPDPRLGSTCNDHTAGAPRVGQCSHIILPLSFFQNGGTRRDLRDVFCTFRPSGAGCKTRLESRFDHKKGCPLLHVCLVCTGLSPYMWLVETNTGANSECLSDGKGGSKCATTFNGTQTLTPLPKGSHL